MNNNSYVCRRWWWASQWRVDIKQPIWRRFLLNKMLGTITKNTSVGSHWRPSKWRIDIKWLTQLWHLLNLMCRTINNFAMLNSIFSQSTGTEESSGWVDPYTSTLQSSLLKSFINCLVGLFFYDLFPYFVGFQVQNKYRIAQLSYSFLHEQPHRNLHNKYFMNKNWNNLMKIQNKTYQVTS